MDQYLANQAVMQAIVPPEYAAAMQAMGQSPLTGLPAQQGMPGPAGGNGAESVGSATALAVYNLPLSADEHQISYLFPRASKVNIINQSDSKRSGGMSILRFDSVQDCQTVFNEIRRGKEIEGQKLRVEVSTNPRYQGSSGGGGDTYGGDYSNGSRHGTGGMGGPERVSSGCCLVVHNLPWAASEREILGEFPSATRVQIKLNDQGQSKGIALLTFANREDCSAALVACACKAMNGRSLRAEIRDSFPEDDGREGGGHGRDHRSDRHEGGRGDRDRDRERDRDRDRERDRDRDRDRDRRRDDDRYGGRPGRDDRRNRGSSGRYDRSGGGGSGGGRRGMGGGGGSGKGPRITSAVIRRLPGDSSDSDFDQDHNY